MIPPNTLRALRFLFRVGYATGSVPFVWDSTQNVVRKTRSGARRFVAMLLTTYVIWNLCFISFRWVQSICCMEVSIGVQIMTLYRILTHASASITCISTLLYGDEIEGFILRLMQTNQRFRSKPRRLASLIRITL